MTETNEAEDSPKRRRKPGRPSILEVRKDPNLAKRAAQMRFLGHSWGQIGSSLELSRTTARRLVLMYRKEIECQSKEAANPSVPKRTDSGILENGSQNLDFILDEDVLERMPKTFQIFSSLLARVRDMNKGID